MKKYTAVKDIIQSIGMSTFISYYYDFKLQKDRQEIIKLFANEKWKENSKNSKASNGLKIFRDGNEKIALELILSSSNLEQAIIDEAYEIYKNEYPNEEFVEYRFIRPEFSFGKDIVENLFSEYKIEKQYQVFDYRIDWYIPELNLAIEFDESQHNRLGEEDLIRQRKIEKKLGCKFIRYKY